jgi:hypothetical protein
MGLPSRALDQKNDGHELPPFVSFAKFTKQKCFQVDMTQAQPRVAGQSQRNEDEQ